MIKVIELVPTLAMGGAETMIKDYCLLFDKEKIDVHVVVIDHRYGTSNEKVLDDKGIKVTYLSELLYQHYEGLNVIQKLIRKVSRYYFFRKIVINDKPDIIHMHLHLDKYIRVLPLHRLNCRLVMTIHNVIDNFFSKDTTAGDKNKEYKEVYRLVHRYNMRLITLHDGLKDELKKYFDTESVSTINNGVVLDRFVQDENLRKKTREELKIRDDEFLIGNVASMSKQKNHEFILDVFEKIAEKRDDVKLLLVGSGDRAEYVRNRIKDAKLETRVTILSNRGDIPALMNAMDVFFFPSRWEGFGNVMIEAQSVGLKCVVSKAVPACTRVSNRVVALDLNDEIDEWANALLNLGYPVEDQIHNIEDYDMKNCVRMLEGVFYRWCDCGQS